MRLHRTRATTRCGAPRRRRPDAGGGRVRVALPPNRDRRTEPFVRACRCSLSRALRAALLASSALIAVAVPARAQDATWLLDATVAGPVAGTFDFNAAANWNPAAVPTGTASFGTSNTPNLSFSSPTTIGGWTFNAGASSYSFTNTTQVQFNGAGIVINGGSATITNNFVMEFFGTSTAGSATITNNDLVQFFRTSTAGSATISNNSSLVFLDTSTADSATITNNNLLVFSTSAGSATITNNANLLFNNTSTGGTARFINGAGGLIDLSQITTAGITAGSIEGAGTISLGSKNLAVGGNNLSTTFSGVLQDGGLGGGVGGSLTKTGTGTLTLTGANTYSGGTTINGGTLAVAADNNLGAAAGGLAFGGGTLQFLAGFTTNRAVTLNAGGGTVDTQSNTATLAGDIGGAGGLTKTGTGTLVLAGNNSYAGSTDISAGVLVVASNTATPGQTFVTVNTGATLAIADGVSAQIGSLADGPLGSGTVLIGLIDPATRLTIGGNSAGSTTFSGTITGAGSLTLSDAASLTLTGTGSAHRRRSRAVQLLYRRAHDRRRIAERRRSFHGCLGLRRDARRDQRRHAADRHLVAAQ